MSDLQTKLEELCVQVFAHCELDVEVNLSGNGTNACEATNFALEVLDLIHGDGRVWRKKNQKRIDKAMKTLEDERG